MKLEDFDYTLPEELIASRPLRERAASRLMVLARTGGEIEHRSFGDLPSYLRAGDHLVLNDTRVIPSRLLGRKETGGAVELFLVERLNSEGGSDGGLWRCMARPGKGLRPGARVIFDKGVKAEVAEDAGDASGEGIFRTVRLSFPEGVGLEDVGEVPLPPYIRRTPDDEDAERYQTVYARKKGAVAAPTAGLHFTEGLLQEIRASGVEVSQITLHTGPGTFLPVRAEEVREHRMLPESYEIPEGVFRSIREGKREGRRVIAVGTTTTRALEAAARVGLDSPRLAGAADIFIYPGFDFKVIDGLVTNFHLPRSTLIMLVAAFAGHGHVMKAYEDAVRERYRFYSYGDAMLII